MSTPEVRVKLTPEGVKEVVDALRLVQREAEGSSSRAARGINATKLALQQFRQILPALGLTVSAAGFIALGRAAFQSANQIIDASKRMRASSEDVSRLAFASNKLNVEFSTLEAGATELQKKISKAVTDPLGEASIAFRQLGLDARDLQGLPLAEQFARIADRVAALSSSEDQLRATTDLLGKGQADLVEVLRQGSTGLQDLAKQSDAAGATISGSMANSIDQADAAIKRLKTSLTGFAREVVAGLSILILGSPDEIQRIDAEIEKLQSRRDSILGSVGNQPDRLPAWSPLRKELDEANQKIEDLLEKQRQLLGLDPAPQQPAPAPSGPSGGTRLLEIETEEDRRRRANALKDRIQDELRLQAEGIQGAQVLSKRSFDQGLISLEEYYARRLALTRAAAEAEIVAAQRQINALQSIQPEDAEARQKQASEIAGLQRDITLRRLQLEQELAAVTGEQVDAQTDLAAAMSRVTSTIAEAEGDRHAAFMANMEAERQEIERTLMQAGVASEEIQRRLNAFSTGQTTRFEFGEAEQAFRRQMEDIANQRQRVEGDVELGVTTERAGRERLLEIESQRLVVLRDLAAAATEAAQASNDEQLIQRAAELSSQVREVELSVARASDAWARFRDSAREGVAGDLQTFLLDTIRDVDSLSDAFKSLGDAILDTFARIAAEAIAEDITKALFGSSAAAGSGSGGGGLLGSLFGFFAGFFSKGGKIGRYAEGGAIDATAGGRLKGPGTPISDSILARVSNGEYVVNARSVRQPGMLPLLDRINAVGLSSREIQRAFDAKLRVPRFAAGGLVSMGASISRTAAGQDLPPVHIHLPAEREGAVTRQTLLNTTRAVADGIARARRRNG